MADSEGWVWTISSGGAMAPAPDTGVGEGKKS